MEGGQSKTWAGAEGRRSVCSSKKADTKKLSEQKLTERTFLADIDILLSQLKNQKKSVENLCKLEATAKACAKKRHANPKRQSR